MKQIEMGGYYSSISYQGKRFIPSVLEPNSKDILMILNLIENQKYGVKLHIFMRKFVQVDKKTQDFIYLGIANSVKSEGNKPIKLELKLEIPLEDKLFEEFTEII